MSTTEMPTLAYPTRAPFKAYVELLKLKIGFMIALSAVMGYVAIARHVHAVEIVLLVLAMVLGSASASVFNHVWDRDIDRVMERTKLRPYATGVLTEPAQAYILAGALLAAGIALSVAVFNVVVALHLFLGAFFYGIVYTVWLKRRTWLNIVIGGAAGSFAVLAGGAVVSPENWVLPLLLAVVLFLWTPSHFWALAILLKDDYAKAKLPMLPVLVGNAATAKAVLINTVLMVGAATLPWALGELGVIYAVGSTLVGAGLLWANWRMVKDPSRVWARRNFLGSMQYLAGLFLAVLADVHISLN